MINYKDAFEHRFSLKVGTSVHPQYNWSKMVLYRVEALKEFKFLQNHLEIKLFSFWKPILREIKHNEKQVHGCYIFI